MNRREFIGALPAAVLLARPAAAQVAAEPRNGVMLMNRIAPSSAELYIAKADGSNERKLLQQSAFEYHAAFDAAGTSVVFTSERNGDGQSDIFRARIDGSGVEPLVTGASMDDAAALARDGSRLAFVSTRDGYMANVWMLDVRSGRLRKVTQGRDPEKPDCYFRPAWSPDGTRLAFSSDRGTPWRGHSDGHGWEHTQELAIYVVAADGTGLRKIASKPDHALGSPKWSADGRRIVFYEMLAEETWAARRPNLLVKATSQIVSVDVATGERIEHTSGSGLKLFPQFVGARVIGYHRKGGPDEGLYYTAERAAVRRSLRSPAWSPDGQSVVYEKVAFRPPRPQGKRLYSWDDEWEYRHTDVFPALSRQGELAITEKQQGNSSIVITKADGSDRRMVFDPSQHGLDPGMLAKGLAGAFQPGWSPDGQWLAFGMGSWFHERDHGKAVLMRVRKDGTAVEALTDGTLHSGFPSYSADGTEIVYRIWGEREKGLRILNLQTRSTRVLTTGYDNLPGWSPDGRQIVFTRKVDAVNFDIFTIRPDGTTLRRLTTHGANDGHAVWTAEGRILWSSGRYGFRDEAALYDDTFQPYGQIFVMDADGSNKRIVTDSLWEDSMPLYIPATFLRPPGK